MAEIPEFTPIDETENRAPVDPADPDMGPLTDDEYRKRWDRMRAEIGPFPDESSVPELTETGAREFTEADSDPAGRILGFG